MELTDVVIIGGGVGGLTVAYGALYNGLRVTLVERQHSLGGESLRHNCIPTKAMFHSAKVAHLIRNSHKYGIDSYLLTVDLAKVNDRVDAVVSTIEAEENSGWLTKMGGRIMQGSPKFLDPSTILVGNTKVRGKNFVIATGSRAAVPKIPGLEAAGYLTNETVFQKISLPEKIIVLGAGPTGIEFAQAFARLGSKVVVIEHSSQILKQEDPELAARLRGALEQEGIQFYHNTYVQEVYWQNKQKILACTDTHGERFSLGCSEVFVAAGRLPNQGGLNLEIAGVHYDADGIAVDQFFRSSNKRIYAVGDVINSSYKYSNVAEFQANSVINHILFKVPLCSKNKVIPRVIYTDPELAQVGLTEQQAARRRFAKVEILKLDLTANDRAITSNETVGSLKLLVSRNRIVGASLLAPQAGELICELALAINLGARLEDIAMTLYPYPTLAQINRRIINQYANKKGLGHYTKKIIALAQRSFA